MESRILVHVLGGLVALGAFGCQKAVPPQERPPAAVTVNQPAMREVIEWDEYPGRLAAVDSVDIQSRVTGYLESVHFKDGAEVAKGDLLFVVDPRPYQAELDHAQAEVQQMESKLELASNDLARADRLLKSKAISEEEADVRSKSMSEAAASLQSARAMAETAKLNFDYTHIMAPINGRIGRKMVTEGNLINGNQGQTTVLTTIVSLDPIYCYFDANEDAILKYQQLTPLNNSANREGPQIPCELGLANETGFPHKGVLDFVDNRVDPGTGTLRVRGTFPNPGPGHSLQPGFFARVRLPGSVKHLAVLIPDEAVGTDQSQKFVYTVNDKNIVEYNKVTLGPLTDGLRIVRAGLETNAWVVVNGLMAVRPGSPVTPTRALIGGDSPPPQANAAQ